MGCFHSTTRRTRKKPTNSQSDNVVYREEEEEGGAAGEDTVKVNSIVNENFSLEDETALDMSMEMSRKKKSSIRSNKSKSLPRTPFNSRIDRQRNQSMDALEEPKAKVTLRQKLTGLAKRTTNSLNFDAIKYRPQLSLDELTKETMLMWAVANTGFDNLLKSSAGRKLFDEFLKKEFSRENLQFWIACENLKEVKCDKDFNLQVDVIFKIYILPTAHNEVPCVS